MPDVVFRHLDVFPVTRFGLANNPKYNPTMMLTMIQPSALSISTPPVLHLSVPKSYTND